MNIQRYERILGSRTIENVGCRMRRIPNHTFQGPSEKNGTSRTEHTRRKNLHRLWTYGLIHSMRICRTQGEISRQKIICHFPAASNQQNFAGTERFHKSIKTL